MNKDIRSWLHTEKAKRIINEMQDKDMLKNIIEKIKGDLK